MLRDRRGWLAWLVTVFLLVLAGCGLFKPRDPRPGGGTVINCATPNSPDDVVSNVLAHYADRLGIGCYNDMLDDSFAFHPDLTDSSEVPPGSQVFVQWRKAVETRDATEIAGRTNFRAAFFDSEYASSVISSDHRTETRFYAYHLIIHAPQISADTLYQGRADITFFQGANGQWHITSWVDKRDASGERTWGYLRRITRVGF